MTETALVPYAEVAIIQDFEGKDLTVKQEGNDVWMTQEECGILLEYKYPRESIHKIYKKHEKEFTNDITRTVVSTTKQSKGKELREFNLEGFAYLCMFSEQPKAELARKWASRLMKEMWVKGHIGGPQIIQMTADEFVTAARQLVIIPRTDLEIQQEIRHKDIVLYTDRMLQDPERFWYFNDPLRDTLIEWRANSRGPKIGVTRITNDLFAEYWLDKKYSPDWIREVFPLDFRFLGEVEAFRKKLGFSPYKSPIMEDCTAKKIFRDKYQFEIDGGFLVRAYPNYTQRTIQQAARLVETDIREIFANNREKGIERDKPSYDDYIKSYVWKVIKRGALIYPEGPIDRCWICFRPLSLATADLHHLTYRRLGEEEYQDAVPLCRECHIYCHPEKNGLPPGVENPNAVIKIKHAKFTEWYKENQKSYACEIGPDRTYVPVFSIHPSSPIQNIGDEGSLIIQRLEHTSHLIKYSIKGV
jgi:hypothetical protein